MNPAAKQRNQKQNFKSPPGELHLMRGPPDQWVEPFCFYSSEPRTFFISQKTFRTNSTKKLCSLSRH